MGPQSKHAIFQLADGSGKFAIREREQDRSAESLAVRYRDRVRRARFD
jgi:hypothetical protein